MTFPVYIPSRYASRYSLLDAMARELGLALAAKGCRVVPWPPEPTAAAAEAPGDRPGMFLFLNFPPTLDALPPAALRPGSRLALVQFFVDHPLALDAELTHRLSKLPNYRLLLPCIDGSHLLRLRWPGLRHAHCLHGVPESALCDEVSIAASRPIDLVIAGSIHTEIEIARLRSAIPASLQSACDEMVRLMLEHPWMPYEQALEVVPGAGWHGGGGVMSGEWRLAAGLWRYTAAALNRERRVRLVRAMHGVRAAVYGAEAWREHCTGTIEYRGDARYEDLLAIFRSARACLAWGPTQFVHTFSERLLLSMAAGCASIADDRFLVQRHFGADSAGGTCVETFNAAAPASARAAVDRVLSDPAHAQRLARAGRARVEAGHLWRHRLDLIAAAGSEALASCAPAPAADPAEPACAA